MKIKSSLLAFLLFAGINTISFSQSSTKTDVNKDIDVVRVYEQVVSEGYGTAIIYKELANAYYFKSEYNKALLWFEKLFETEKTNDPDILQRYKQTLKAVKSSENSKAVVKI